MTHTGTKHLSAIDIGTGGGLSGADEALLCVHLLGGFRVSIGASAIEDRQWSSRKATTLVKLLALAPRHRLHREQIYEVLWPEFDPSAASNNLYYTLHIARRILGVGGSSWLKLQNDQVSLGTDSSVWTDVEAFEHAAELARHGDDLAAYRAALNRYPGELLPDDLYEDWASPRREELRSSFVSCLLEYARLCHTCGELGQAITELERALSYDSTLEEAHTELMRVWAESGQRQRALRQFEQLRQAMERELDAVPDPTSRQLYEDILAGQIPVSAASSPPSAPSAPSHNLPISLTSFIGRESAVARVREAFTSSRLLTFTGAGGTGKTRLAQEAARHLLYDYPDGVWLVELASLTPGEDVARTVAVTLSIEERSGETLLSTVLEVLAAKHVLVLLDNCEHVVDSAARLCQAVLAVCPHVHMLVTSREALNIPGEAIWRVPPLAIPPADAPLGVNAIRNVDAIQLFVERAAARQPGFALSTQNAPDVARICRRLDGLPLAIELAAARVGVLGLDQIAARLNNALGFLTGGNRTATPRQRTLRGALDWSYDLLPEAERVLLRRLSVFVGGWSMEAAESIGGDGPHDQPAILDLLSFLVDKSLVVAQATPGGTVRYSMLEPVRQYAQELLLRDPMAESVKLRHAAIFADLAERAQPELRGPNQIAWYQRLDEEHENLRAALRHAIDRGDAEMGMRLTGSLWRFWATRGHTSEGRSFQRQVLELPGADLVNSELRARDLSGAGALAYYQADYTNATRLYEASLELRRRLGDSAGISSLLGNLALVAKEQGEYERAAALHEESLALARLVNNTKSVAASLNNLGILLQDQGEYERATDLHQESLAIMRELGDLQGIVNSLNNLGAIALECGKHDLATQHTEQALTLAGEIGSRRSSAVALINLGRLFQEQGSYHRAEDRLRAAIRIVEPTGDAELAASCLAEWATLAVVRGQHSRAARLFGAAMGMRKASGSRLTPLEQVRLDTRMGEARAALPAYAFEAAFTTGESMTLEDAFTFALSTDEPEQATAAAALTPREREIAQLIGGGLTNRQIAAELCIAERTVDTHVDHILRKLGVSTRTAVPNLIHP